MGVISTGSSGSVISKIKGAVSTVNSTTSTLLADGVFTGTAEDCKDCAMILVTSYSDVASATDGLSVQFSGDGTNWDASDDFTIAAGSAKTFSFQPVLRYFRVVYTNGPAGQSEFRLQAQLKPQYTKASSHRVKDTIVGDDDVELVKAALTGENGDGSWHNVKTTSDGYLAISDNSSGLAIAQGNVTGYSFVHKFGQAKDFDTDDGEVTVWDGADDGEAWELMDYTYSTTADIDSISSSDAGDTQSILIQGLDSNYDPQSETVTLNGQTRVALANTYIRIFRGYNDNSTEFSGHVIVYVNTALTAGVPTDKTKIRMVIHPEDQQTEMAVYTIPNGYTGYMRDWYISTSGGSKSSNYVFYLKSRINGKVFRTKHTTALESLSPVPYQHKYEEPEVFTAKTDIEMRVESIASPVATENSVSAGFDIVLVAD